MFTSFNTALSGLMSSSTAVDIVGNNLANLNTTGYKATEAQFADLVSQAMGGGSASNEVGLGVSGAESVREFTQGSILQTTGAFDAAINGDGFFVVRDSTNQLLYTRAGNFTLDSTGHLQTATGQDVEGWSAVGGTVNTNGTVGDIVIPLNGTNPATATTNMSASLNLNANATVGGANATYSTPVQVVDSLGDTHTLTLTFTKTNPNTWSYSVTVPSADLATPSTTPVATGTLTFDSSGNLTSPAATDAPIALNVTGLADGAADLKVNWNLFNSGTSLVTQFAQSSGVSATKQDGIQAGQITKVAIEDSGTIVASYSNGQQATVGQIAIASIENPGSMLAVGNNNFQASVDTSAPAIGTAGTGGRGQIQGGSLEASTVDIATEFTNLMTFQRSYQADSRVITTTDNMIQDLISLIR